MASPNNSERFAWPTIGGGGRRGYTRSRICNAEGPGPWLLCRGRAPGGLPTPTFSSAGAWRFRSAGCHQGGNWGGGGGLMSCVDKSQQSGSSVGDAIRAMQRRGWPAEGERAAAPTPAPYSAQHLACTSRPPLLDSARGPPVACLPQNIQDVRAAEHLQPTHSSLHPATPPAARPAAPPVAPSQHRICQHRYRPGRTGSRHRYTGATTTTAPATPTPQAWRLLVLL